MSLLAMPQHSIRGRGFEAFMFSLGVRELPLYPKYRMRRDYYPYLPAEEAPAHKTSVDQIPVKTEKNGHL